MSVKELFKKFVFGYIAASHTQTEESEAELEQWIDKFVDTLNEEACFNNYTMCGVLCYVESNMSDENKSFYTYNYKDSKYIQYMEKFIKFHIYRHLNTINN